MSMCVVLAVIISLMVSVPVWSDPADADGDGLSDFAEAHKYGTDPGKRDSDGDGFPDGDWHERREYAYTVRTVVRVMHPCNLDAINDDHQDARVLYETDEYVELEVIHYPFNTVAESITGDPDWSQAATRMSEYVKPGITTNWDDRMRTDLLQELRDDKILIERMTDRQIVERVAPWLLSHATYYEMFGTYFVHFPEGRAEIVPGLEDAFAREKGNTDFTLDEQLQRELFGKGMFHTASRGSCTSTAIYLTTGLRALGLPARMVLAIPVIDGSDTKQRQMIEDHVRHHRVRETILSGIGSSGFIAHTFNEVFVGGRWHRLNYATLGQNIYGEGAMGLMTHVNTFTDLSEANLARTWGWRYGRGERNETFPFQNPYRTMEISDRFGLYCTMPNPARTEVRILKAYWFLSDERPAWIREDAVHHNGDGHMLVHVDVSFKALRIAYPKLNKDFTLEAEGHPTIHAKAERGYWNSECYIRIPREEFERMAEGVAYRLVPRNVADSCTWVVDEGVSIVK